MDKSKYVLNAFKELIDKREIRNEDYEAVLESVVNHYDMALVGNLLFIKFVEEIDNVREVSTADKTIIEIPIRSNRNNGLETLLTKWQKVLKRIFGLDLTETEFWVVNKDGNGIIRTHAYAVKFRGFPWIGYFEDEVGKITNKITKEFVYNEKVKKELEEKVCSCIKAKIMIDVDEFLIYLTNHIEGVMKYGIRTKVAFDEDGVKKPTLIQEKSGNGYSVLIPYCSFDEYINLFKNTLGFHQSVYDSNVLFPNGSIMASML